MNVTCSRPNSPRIPAATSRSSALAFQEAITNPFCKHEPLKKAPSEFKSEGRVLEVMASRGAFQIVLSTNLQRQRQ